MSLTVMIRCDGSHAMGIGHVSRCNTLAAQMQAEGHTPRFACRPLAGDQRDRLRSAGFDVIDLDVTTDEEDAESLAAEADRSHADWILLDHPTLALDYERAVRHHRPGPLAVIDGQFRPHDCDLLINPNVYADRNNSLPTVPPHCEILAGYRYFLLREAFRIASDVTPSEEHSVLLTLGGADPDNLTLAICRQLNQLRIRCRFDVVIGPANRHARQLEQALLQMDDGRFRIHRHPEDFPELLARCTVCVSAGGITLGECAYLGKPVVALIIAENQRRTVERLASSGAAIAAEADAVGEWVDHLLRTPEQRETLSAAIGGLVDGRGAERVVGALIDTEPAEQTLHHAR